MREWTDEQKRVIDTRGCNLLVSAAAGSGKTAVLVQRVIDRLLDESDPLDIDRLLVVTFTNAAAAEMRQRIRDALAAKLEEDPENTHLQRQEALVHQAMIMTIHSFCGEVIRSHIHLTEADPLFRIAEEGEISLLRQDVMRDMLETLYEAPTDLFLETVDTFASGKDDSSFEKILLRLYEYSMADPDPKGWRERALEAYRAENGRELAETPWMPELMRMASGQAEDMHKRLSDALHLASMPDGPARYADDLSWHLEAVGRILAAKSYQERAEALRMADRWDRLPTISAKSGVDPQLKDRASALRQSVKTDLGKMREEFFSMDESLVLEVMKRCRRTAGELVRLTNMFSDALDKAKRDKNLLDFHDLEHMALKILTEHPEIAAQYREHFQEIMTDEYQDCNLVQERITQSIAGSRNRFMVGDVKQSIYRFRLARPELFMDKYRQYTENEESGTKIDLHKNFRSRSQVLDAVNMVFRQIMAEDIGGITYDSSAMLHPGAVFAPNEEDDYLPELLLVKEAYPETDENYGMMIRQEAMCVGRRILSLVGEMRIWDGREQAYRPAGYGDMAILLRTVSEWGETFTSVLTDMGIPAVSANSRGYFRTLEIRTVLSALQVISNPRQDIPLAAFLRSPMIGLTDEQLAMIHAASAASKKGFFEECEAWLRENAESDTLTEKLRAFFDLLGELRSEMTFMPVHELIRTLLDRTGYGNYVLAMPGGEQRGANLEQLIRKAAAFEKSSYRGLFHFLRYIENLQEADVDFGEASSAENAGNAVRIMSIHKSKGLEFPIVFVSGLGKQFNRTDSMSPLVLHPSYGFGCSCIDTIKRVKYPVLYRQFLARLDRQETLGEELRVLYVAMTRAKEKLILTGVPTLSANSVQALTAAAQVPYQLIGAGKRKNALTSLDFLLPALLRHKSGEMLAREFGYMPDPLHPSYDDGQGFSIRFVTCLAEDPKLAPLPELKTADAFPETDMEKIYDPVLYRRIAAFPKEEEEYVPVPGSISVSDLKKYAPEESEAEETWFLYADDEAGEPGLPGGKKPRGPEKGNPEGHVLRGAERGTLYHRVLELWDFASDMEVQRQLEWLTKCGKIQKNDLQSIDSDEIGRLLSSNTGRRIRAAALAGRLRRETPFVLSVPAGEVLPEYASEEPVLIQGVIDVWFEEDDGIVLLDYKTDTGIDPDGRELISRHAAQLRWYRQALERLVGKPVKESVIWSFELGKEIVLS